MNADEDEDDVTDHLKQKAIKTLLPRMGVNFLKANENREIGQIKGYNIKANIQAFAEDELVRKEYKELKCEMPGTPRSTFLMVFSPDGSKVASTHGNHNIYITDLRTGKNIKTLVGHPRTPWCIAFHPTSNDLVASGCLGGQVRIWDLSGGSEVWTSDRENVISSIAFHPTDRLVVIATFHELFFWDWSKPDPFLHTTTSNAKEKVRYVAFDKLGHKLITGISNSPQSRWDRNRVSVPISERSGSPYRRRIFPRVGSYSSYSSPFQPTTSNSAERPSVSTVPERERRITACYRNLVHEYELLVHRYLQIYRPPTTMDRGTDPMDLDQQPSTSSGSSSQRAADHQEAGPSNVNNNSSGSNSTTLRSPSLGSLRLLQKQNTQEQTKSTQTTPPSSSFSPKPKAQEQPREMQTQTQSNRESRKRKLSALYASTQSNSETPSTSSSRNESTSSTINVSPENRELATAVEDSTERDIHILCSEPSSSNFSPPSSSAASSSPSTFKRCLILRTSVPLPANTDSPETSRYNIYRMCIKCSPRQNLNGNNETNRNNLVNLKENIAEIQRSLSEVSNLSKANQVNQDRNANPEPSTSRDSNQTPINRDNQEREHERHTGSQLKRPYTGFLKKSNRRSPLDTSSDSSSEDEERRKKRLYSHRNYSHVASRNQNAPSTSETQESGRRNTDNPSPISTSSNIPPRFTPLSFSVIQKPECSQNVNPSDTSLNALSNDPSNSPPDNASTSGTIVSPSGTQTPLTSIPSTSNTNILTSRTDTEPCARTLMNTDTRTTNSTVYTPSGNRRRLFSQRFSAFYPTRVYNVRSQSRLRRTSSFLSPALRNMIDELETFDADNNRLPINLAPDEVINYSERANPEDDPSEQPPPEFHPFDPPPDVPSINPENIGIGNMYSNIIQDLEISLRNVRNIRASNRPGETSDMLSSFSERLESIMQQSNSILRNLRNTMDMLPPSTRNNDTVSNQHSSRAPERPHFTFNDPNFYVRDNSENSPAEGSSSTSFNNRNAVTTDHTYPRNPTEYNLSTQSTENMAPLMTSLHLTISHIQRQAGLLHRQVESIERIDRAMLEVAQLQMIRQMFEELRRHINAVGNSDSRSGVSSVRQMMAGTRISDTSPYDSPNESNDNAEQNVNSTNAAVNTSNTAAPERTSSAADVRTSGNTTQSSRSNARKSYPPSRLQQIQRQNRRFSVINLFPPRRMLARDRFLRRRDSYRSLSARPVATRSQTDSTASRLPEGQTPVIHLNTDILNIMVKRLEQLLNEHIRLIGLPPHLQPVPVRDNREHVVIERLNRCRLRLNHTLGRMANSNMHPSYRIEVSSATQDSMLRFGAREAMSLILNTFTRFFENATNVNFSQGFRSHMRVVIDLSLLLSDILLLHIIDSIPPPTGMNLDPERESLSARIDQACCRMLQNRVSNLSHVLTRSLRTMRLTARYTSRSLDQLQYNTRRNAVTPNRNNSDGIREMLGRMTDALRNMHTIRGMSYTPLEMPSRSSEFPSREWPRTSSNQDELTNSDDDTETAFFNNLLGGENEAGDSNNNNGNNNNNTSSSSSSSNNSTPSYSSRPLYRSSNTYLLNNDDASPSSGQSRTWNVPTVQINDVPVSEPSFSNWQTRMLPLRYRLSELRANNAPNIFRPRFFLLPPFGGINVNPLESDVDDPQRDTLNDGDMVMAVTPNHRIQAWDISTGAVPDIRNAFKNVVVGECKIHNDASVDISNDGNILVTLLPSSGYLNYSNRLGVYSLRWETLGQCLYITSFEQNAVSVSLSPLSRHLVVGLASRRMSIIPSEKWTMARIFLIDSKKTSYGNRMTVLRDIDQHRDSNFMSLNCIRWLPISGQGLIYATNTGQLRILS